MALLLMAPIVSSATIKATTNSASPATPRLYEQIQARTYPADLEKNEVWVRIDLDERQLLVYRGREIVSTIPHVAIGSNGAKAIRFEGSKVTPVGEFRIEVVNPQSQFNRFYGIDYPNLDVAQAALDQGLIPRREYQHIEQYWLRYGRAPANTSLGGNIGIHGLGGRSPVIHQKIDWTLGCVAVSDQEINALSPWLKVGTRVRIDA